MDALPIIRGVGLVTSLGTSTASTWEALLTGRYITHHAPAMLPRHPRVTRVSQLAIHAAREAIEQAAWRDIGQETALVVGTSKGPIESWLAASTTSDNLAAGGSAGGFGLSTLALDIRRSLALGNGPCLTLSAACASGLHALARAAMLIERKEVRRVLVVAAEASLHPLFIGSFQRLGVLPAEGVGCRPFDQQRDGFLLSEAAAAVCLEARTPANVGDRRHVSVERYALSGDAAHLTGPDPTGRTLQRLLARVASGRTIDLIHAHATGTVINDPIELAAIESIVAGIDGPRPNVYSHKGALGHSLGAAGLVSVVLNCMAHEKGIVPPNVRTTQALPTVGVGIDPFPVAREIRRSLVIAAGFGGAMAAVNLVTA